MIHKLTANKSSFHPVEFNAGLNVIVAKRTKEATKKDTRNGLGKSTLIEIIDFCLGSRHHTGRGLCIKPLQEWAFTLDITLAGKRVRATRAVESPNRIVVDGPTDGWNEQPDQDQETGDRYFNLVRWKTLLGWAMFGLRTSYDELKYRPSYRSLISYLIRRGAVAYDEPFRHFRQQATWDSQLHIAYLLGLNWEVVSRWQVLRDEEEMISTFAKAVESGAVQSITGTVGELEAKRVQLDAQLKRDGAALASFQVHPQYEELQAEANTLTKEIHDLANANVSDRRRLSRYEESVADEAAPNANELERVYAEANLAFPEGLKRTLEDAKGFHTRVLHNRRAFLQAEIRRLERQIEDRDVRARTLMDQRAEALKVLHTHGALQEFTELQSRLSVTKEMLERVSSQIDDIKKISARQRDIIVTRANLSEEAERDREERRSLWSEAISLFNEHSEALYESPGRLVIDIDQTGYRFDVEIQRSESGGIGKMKVFCFDLMLLQLQQRHQHGINFLIHDSVIFDGVDSRQRALSLERAAEVTSSQRLQYICTVNSDMIPSEDFSPGFDFKSYVCLELSDRDPSGSLLGIRFQTPKKRV